MYTGAILWKERLTCSIYAFLLSKWCVEQLDPGWRAMHFTKYILYKEFFLGLPIKVFVDPMEIHDEVTTSTNTCNRIQTYREIQNGLSGDNTGLCAPNFFIL